MSTLKELTYSIRESLQQYDVASDITNEYIKFLIKNTRAMLLSQKYSNRSNFIPNKSRQHFHKDLELSEENEFYNGIGTILRTKDPIDPPLEGFNFRSNLRVSSGSYKDIYFTYIDESRVPFIGSNKWNQNNIYVWLGTDFRLYISSSSDTVKLLENLKLSYVCEDPEEAYPSTIYYNSSVDFDDTEYPMEEELFTQVTDVIVKKLTAMLGMPEDSKNDSNDIVSQQ